MSYQLCRCCAAEEECLYRRERPEVVLCEEFEGLRPRGGAWKEGAKVRPARAESA